MKECKSCDRVNISENYTFCIKCGKELTFEPKCSCGYTLSSFEKFCPKCGKQSITYKDN